MSIEEKRGSSKERRARVLACAYGINHNNIISTYSDGTINIWNVNEREVRDSFLGHEGNINACCFSVVDNEIASASDDFTIKIWDFVDGDLKHTFGHSHQIKSCAWGKNGRWLISVDSGGNLAIFEASTKKMVRAVQAHQMTANSCSYSNRKIATASDDGTLKIWQEHSFDKPLRLLSGHQEAVKGCCFSPDGKLVVSASSDQTVKVWDISTGHCRATFYADGPMYCCAMHEDMIVAGGARGVYFLKLLK